jgi:hypothetical protein
MLYDNVRRLSTHHGYMDAEIGRLAKDFVECKAIGERGNTTAISLYPQFLSLIRRKADEVPDTSPVKLSAWSSNRNFKVWPARCVTGLDMTGPCKEKKKSSDFEAASIPDATFEARSYAGAANIFMD